MAKVLLRCRDAEMLGPFCDYVAEAETFDEVVREMRVHAKTHHERDITDEDVAELKKMLKEDAGKMAAKISKLRKVRRFVSPRFFLSPFFLNVISHE